MSMPSNWPENVYFVPELSFTSSLSPEVRFPKQPNKILYLSRDSSKKNKQKNLYFDRLLELIRGIILLRFTWMEENKKATTLLSNKIGSKTNKLRHTYWMCFANTSSVHLDWTPIEKGDKNIFEKDAIPERVSIPLK